MWSPHRVATFWAVDNAYFDVYPDARRGWGLLRLPREIRGERNACVYLSSAEHLLDHA